LLRRNRISSFLFFVAFSWAGIGMGVDLKSGLITQDFSTFLEKKLNTVFVDKKVELSRVESSGFKNLAIKDFAVSRKSDSSPVFSVDKIIIKYNLLDLALRRFENLGGIYLVSPSLFFARDQGVGGISLPGGASSYFSGAAAYGAKPIKFRILNGSITVLGREPVLKNLEGAVTFYNSDLRLENLKGAFLNCPVLVNGKIENALEAPVVKLRLLAADKYYALTCTFTQPLLTAKETLKKQEGAGFKTSDRNGKGAVWGRLRLFDRFDMRFKGVINISQGKALEIEKLVVTSPIDPKTRFIITGDVNLSDNACRLIITPKAEGATGNIQVATNISKAKGLIVSAKLNHINIMGHDVLSQLDASANFYKTANPGEGVLRGALKTQNLIVDYKPFKEIEASWILKKKELFITNFDLGVVYRLFGKVNLSKPYDIDLNLSINNAELADWGIFSRANAAPSVSGLVVGRLKVKGPFIEPSTNGKIDIREGNINDIKFNAINFNLKGKGPILVVSDSRISKEGGFLYINGYLDMRKFGRRNMMEDLKITTDQKIIVWEGWDITKSTSEVEARKALSEDFDVNFKTEVGEKDVGIDDGRKESEIGLDYKIQKDDSINVRMKNDGAFVGVKHKVKF